LHDHRAITCLNLNNFFCDGMAKAQEIAAEKMKPLMGGLGNLGL
jgi:nucleoid-associated protein EbfC